MEVLQREREDAQRRLLALQAEGQSDGLIEFGMKDKDKDKEKIGQFVINVRDKDEHGERRASSTSFESGDSGGHLAIALLFITDASRF